MDLTPREISLTAKLSEVENENGRLQAENERLTELLRGTGANRYWEGRWRDEKAENERLREALRYGIGSAINELTARGLPKEWSPRSGIGRMLEALGFKSTFFDEEVRRCLAVELGESMSSGNNQS